MRRSLTVSAVLSAALVTAAVPFLGAASAAPCPTWIDAKGDATFVAAPDNSVDITAVLVEPGATALTATFTVPELKDVNEFAPGDRFALTMQAGGLKLEIFGDRDDVDAQDALGSVSGATGPAATKFGGTITHDVAGKKVVLSIPNAVIDGALGKPFAGMQLKSFVGSSAIHFGPMTSSKFDSAPAPETVTGVGGVACGEGAGPAPKPSPTTPAPTTPAPPTSPPASGAMPTDLPREGCFHVADDKGDAKINGQVPNDPDLDITSLTLRSSNGWLLAYMKADKLANGPTMADGHRYTVEFVHNKHLFTVAASSYKTAESEDIREGLAATGRNGHMVQMSLDTVSSLGTGTAVAYAEGQVEPPFVDSGSKAVFDTKSGYVTIAIPIADIEKYGQAKLTSITAVTGKSSADYWRNSLGADTTAKANAAASTDAWTLGDNKCFPQPVATAISLAVAKKANTRTVTAKLTAAGKPLGGQVVTWLVNGKKAGTTVTSAAGTALFRTAKPTQTVTAEFAGVADKYLPSKTSTRV